MRKIIGGILIVLVFFTNAYPQSGQPDPAFGNGGKLIINEVNNKKISPDSYGVWPQMAIQPDGKIILTAITKNMSIATGNDMLIMRLNHDGKIDSSFGENGAVVIEYVHNMDDVQSYITYAKDVAVTLQGKIVLAA